LRRKTRKKWNFFLGNFFSWRWKGAKRLKKKKMEFFSWKFFFFPLSEAEREKELGDGRKLTR
jgi:hypothetical protein